jgi:hypothetical protein
MIGGECWFAWVKSCERWHVGGRGSLHVNKSQLFNSSLRNCLDGWWNPLADTEN